MTYSTNSRSSVGSAITLLFTIGCAACGIVSAAASATANRDLLGLWTSRPGTFDGIRSAQVTVAQVKTALDHGASVDARDAKGDTSLFAAAYGGNSACVKYLLFRGASATLKDIRGETALSEAAGSAFFSQGHAARTSTSAHQRVKPLDKEPTGTNQCVVLLLAADADPNTMDKAGYTALMWSSYMGNIECVKLLIAHGAKIDLLGAGGTAFRCALVSGQLQCGSLLIARGANVNAVDDNGDTALMAVSEAGKLSSVQFLLSHGARVNVKDKHGNTPLSLARRHPAIVSALKMAGEKK